MSEFKIKASGFDKAITSMSKARAVAMMVAGDVIVERNTRNMANKAAELAPRKTGKLKGSIPPSVRRAGHTGAWQFGSDVEYAEIQEYTNAHKKGFFRKSVFMYRNELRKELGKILKGGL